MLRVQVPQRHVSKVDPPVRDEAAAVVPPAAPAQPSLFERTPRRRSLKELPIQTVRDRSFRFRRRSVPAPAELDDGMSDFSELSVLDDLGGFLKMLPRPLLRAELDDTLRRLVGAERLDGPLDGVGQRLLDVDVLAGSHGVDQHLAVPMIRRRDEDGVDIVAIEDTPVILVRVELHVLLQFRQLLHTLIEPRLVRVTCRDVLNVGMIADKQGGHRPAPAAGPDQGDANLVVWPSRPGLCTRAAAGDEDTCGTCRKIEEPPTAQRGSGLLMSFLRWRCGSCQFPRRTKVPAVRTRPSGRARRRGSKDPRLQKDCAQNEKRICACIERIA